MSNVAAVIEQQKLFNELRSKFSKRLQNHLEERFLAQRDTIGNATDDGRLRLPRHHNLHKKLSPYRPLVLWLRSNDQTAFMSLVAIYTESIRSVYRREIRSFRELAEKRFEQQIQEKQEREKTLRSSSGMGLRSGSTKNLGGSTKSLSKTKFGGSIKNLSMSSISLAKKSKKFASSLSLGNLHTNRVYQAQITSCIFVILNSSLFSENWELQYK